TAIKARLHRGDRRACDCCNFIELHFFLKAQNQDFAIDRGNFLQRELHAFPSFRVENLFQGRFGFFVLDIKSGRAVFRAAERFEAMRFLAAMPIEHEVAGDGEKPGLKFPAAIVLVAALENTQPGFLKKVFGAFLAAREVNKVTEQPELILLDEAVEEVGIAALEGAGERLSVVEHEGGEAYRAGPRYQSRSGWSCFGWEGEEAHVVRIRVRGRERRKSPNRYDPASSGRPFQEFRRKTLKTVNLSSDDLLGLTVNL